MMDERVKEIAEILLYVVLGYLIAMGALKGASYFLETDYPAVSVITTSMEHDNPQETYVNWMLNHNYSKKELKNFPFPSGLRQGDLIIAKGSNFKEIEPGDVIIYEAGKRPIIHRVVARNETVLYTKGDNNRYLDQHENIIAPPITENSYEGKALIRMPLLGYVKVFIMKASGEV